MRVAIECEKCGNQVEIIPETYGNVAYFKKKLSENGFSISHITIEAELQQEKVCDADDVDTTLKEIRINCDCGEYINLSF